MKNFIFYLLLLFSIISCKDGNPTVADDSLKNKAEQLLLKEMDDPKSYEFIAFEVDTIDRSNAAFRKETLQKMIDTAKSENSKKAAIGYFNQTPNYPINQIEYKLVFRANNKAGALEKQELQVVSDKSNNLLYMGIKDSIKDRVSLGELSNHYIK